MGARDGREGSIAHESDLGGNESLGLQEAAGQIPWDPLGKDTGKPPAKLMQRARNEKRKTRSICIPAKAGYEQLAGSGESVEKGAWKLEADPRVSLWQRDKELYEAQSKTMLQQIMVLTIQLDEAKSRANECTV